MTLIINGKTYEAGELIAYVQKLEKENTELRALKEKCKFNVNDIFKDIETEKQLTNAKEIIKKLKALYLSPVVTKDDVKRQDEILAEAEQFLKGCK